MTALQTIEQVIRDYANRGIVPYEINNGYCVDWAEEVFRLLEHSGQKVELWETMIGFADTHHAFLRIDGLFCDAEAPQGVADHMELPIFARIGAKRQPVWRIDANHDEGTMQEGRREITQAMLIAYDAENGTNNSTQ